MFVVLPGPIYHQAPVRLEGLQQGGLGDVPRDPAQENPGGVGGVLVPASRELAAPGADDLRAYWKGGRKGGRGGREGEREGGREGGRCACVREGREGPNKLQVVARSE